MKTASFFLPALLLTMIIFLLLCPADAMRFAGEGLLLWYHHLLPILFPFMILSNLMIRTGSAVILLRWIHPLFHRIWGISPGGSYAVFAGFLFGCPMGAKVVHDLWEQKLLTETEASYLLCFVNNLSPAFLISFLVRENLKQPNLLLPTLGILYGAPLITSFLLAPRFRGRSKIMDGQKNKASEVLLGTELLDACIVDGIATITKLGGYIMLFSLISGALSLLIPKQWPLYGILKAGLEITSGIRWICQSKPDPLPKYLSLMALCSFGGGCALIQTVCAASMKKQMIVRYLFAKLITVTVSILLTLLLFL